MYLNTEVPISQNYMSKSQAKIEQKKVGSRQRILQRHQNNNQAQNLID